MQNKGETSVLLSSTCKHKDAHLHILPKNWYSVSELKQYHCSCADCYHNLEIEVKTFLYTSHLTLSKNQSLNWLEKHSITPFCQETHKKYQ